MKHRVFFIVMLFGLMSCGAQKTVVSQEIQAESSVQVFDSTYLKNEIDKRVQEALSESLTTIVNQTVDVEKTIYSAPDSAGTQYVVETQQIRVKTAAEKSQTRTIQMEIEISEKSDSTSISASVEDLEMETSTNVTETTGLPWWQKSLMLLGAAVLILLIIRIVLKFI